ncbi:hypothetical protein DCS_06217 [Drechmeria coniospora]|uniref:Protein HRI1 n=1 Tax=Drechmeria coniospora TaxID=98403 RepID=A0A151GAY3_DRECN|nr:hypothetical protein DCS_06217 [Drechmeria coniospora]KYK54260.1 hypothetical protein DCS_06217 [Drechmeria coniospora]
MASISIRESIRWLPDEAAEPTTTIVLTSPQRRFVDLRVFKPPTGENAEDGNDDLPLTRLDWAVAGSTSSVTHPNGRGTHAKWHHWVDSMTNDAEAVVDEGDMVTQPDGTTLEMGSMVNPATGKDTSYEEVWRDFDPLPPPGSTLVCLVLERDEGGCRGRVVRLGRYCQGFVRAGERIALERWQWSPGGGGWRRAVSMSDGSGDGALLALPCSAALEDGTDFRVGEFVGARFEAWKVVEVVHQQRSRHGES